VKMPLDTGSPDASRTGEPARIVPISWLPRKPDATWERQFNPHSPDVALSFGPDSDSSPSGRPCGAHQCGAVRDIVKHRLADAGLHRPAGGRRLLPSRLVSLRLYRPVRLASLKRWTPTRDRSLTTPPSYTANPRRAFSSSIRHLGS
jgi:hypothetical protein